MYMYMYMCICTFMNMYTLCIRLTLIDYIRVYDSHIYMYSCKRLCDVLAQCIYHALETTL